MASLEWITSETFEATLQKDFEISSLNLDENFVEKINKKRSIPLTKKEEKKINDFEKMVDYNKLKEMKQWDIHGLFPSLPDPPKDMTRENYLHAASLILPPQDRLRRAHPPATTPSQREGIAMAQSIPGLPEYRRLIEQYLGRPVGGTTKRRRKRMKSRKFRK